MARMIILVGTKKGVFLLEGTEARDKWEVRGPFCEAWPINHVHYDPATKSIVAAGGDAWYGSAVWRSPDLGETWTHSSQGITYGDEGPKMKTLWHIQPAHGALYIGAEPAGMFKSTDGGETWEHVTGLTEHPTRPEWQAGGGGLCLHSIVPHHTDPNQMWVAASAVGTFYTKDGGKSWTPQNAGIRADYLPPEAPRPEIGFCVHKLLLAPGDSGRLYQQNHQGVYRSDDGGYNWQWINEGLPSTFGFPMGVHPRDPETAWVVPLNGDSAGRFMPDGQAQVWRTRNGGESWEKLTKGLPAGAYVGVLREGMAVDKLDKAGVYVGTSTGQVFVSADEGDTWQVAADYLPSISSIEVAVVEE